MLFQSGSVQTPVKIGYVSHFVPAHPAYLASKFFLFGGNFILIDGDEDRPMLLESALSRLSSTAFIDALSDQARAILSQRVAAYPTKTRTNVHRSRVRVPRSIAQILTASPQLIAPAIEAFYTRDALDMRACSLMSKFRPDTAESVTFTATFTRNLYAKLTQQQFYPPKCFGLPSTNSPDFKAAELGMKLVGAILDVATDA